MTMSEITAPTRDIAYGSDCQSKQSIYNRMIHVYETDKDGVVHFSNYFRFAEEALYSGLRDFGFSFEQTEYSMAMIDASANYIRPIKFAEQLNIVISDIKVKRVKLVALLDFSDSQQNNVARIQLTFVLIDSENRRSMPVPEHLKSSLSQVIAKPEECLGDSHS